MKQVKKVERIKPEKTPPKKTGEKKPRKTRCRAKEIAEAGEEKPGRHRRAEKPNYVEHPSPPVTAHHDRTT